MINEGQVETALYYFVHSAYKICEKRIDLLQNHEF